MSDIDIEGLIFSHIIYDEEYARAVLPHMKIDYFTNRCNRRLYQIINEFFDKFNKCPSAEIVRMEINDLDLLENDYKELCALSDSLMNKPPEINKNYLLEKTEKFCQDRSIYNAIMQSIQILDGEAGVGKGAIPQLLSEALSVAFDNRIGHDYFEDSENRYEEYHRKLSRIPFHLSILNKITNGGILRKTLNMLLGVTGAGKTHVMCDFAAGHLTAGLNVLYITLEMAEERIAERIDANLMNVTMNELRTVPKDSYIRKIDRIMSKTRGKLIIKEFPTATVGAGHFRHLLNELKTKKNFIPDVIYIDYINLCSSSRMKMGANINTYSYIKAIAEEIRGLAVEFNVAIWSATQANRDGYKNTDIDLTNTSESIGLPQTVDFMLGMVVTDELEDMKRMMIKQLKNRYNDPSYYRRFTIGSDRSRMKLFDVEQQEQDNSPSPVDPAVANAFKSNKPRIDFNDWK